MDLNLPIQTSITIRPIDCIEETISNWDIVYSPTGLTGKPSTHPKAGTTEHYRIMRRKYADGRREAFIIPDDNLTETITWNNKNPSNTI